MHLAMQELQITITTRAHRAAHVSQAFLPQLATAGIALCAVLENPLHLEMSHAPTACQERIPALMASLTASAALLVHSETVVAAHSVFRATVAGTPYPRPA